jgi:hypothetical protein
MSKPTTGYPGGRSFSSGYYTTLLARDSLNGAILHAGMGGQSFFWGHDSLFIDYHAYTAPDGISYLNIKPVYADTLGWLTLDATKGKIITGTPTAIANRSIAASPVSLPSRGSNAVRFIGKGTTAPAMNATRALYTIIGQRIDGKTATGLPTGICIEKTVFTK